METPKNGSQGLTAPQTKAGDLPNDGLAVSRSDGEATPLGKFTNTPTDSIDHNTNSPSTSARSAAVLRFILQAKARDLLPDQRVAWCLRRFRPGRIKVDIVKSSQKRLAYFDGLTRCARIWQCPVCAAKITEERRIELTELLNLENVVVVQGAKVLYFPRWHLSLLTYTIQHKASEPFEAVMQRLNKAWKLYAAGRWMVGFRDRYYIRGTLRALEVTHGAKGWHPHYHVLMFHDSQLQLVSNNRLIPTLSQMLDAAQSRWSEVLGTIGGYADHDHGVDLTIGDIAKYPLKMAGDREAQEWGLTSEATKQPSKRGRENNRSLSDLLVDAVKGDERSGVLWREAALGLARQKHLEPSKGLWKMLGRELKTDDQAAEDEQTPNDKVLASLTWEQWKTVLYADARGAVLDIAASGDEDALWTYLGTLGVHRD